MKKLALGNQKGGVGKTTTTRFLAEALAVKQRKRVLVIDADPQASLTEITAHKSGQPVANVATHELVTVLEGNAAPTDAIYPTTIANVDILPASIELAAPRDGYKQLTIYLPIDVYKGLRLKVFEREATYTGELVDAWRDANRTWIKKAAKSGGR